MPICVTSDHDRVHNATLPLHAPGTAGGFDGEDPMASIVDRNTATYFSATRKGLKIWTEKSTRKMA